MTAHPQRRRCPSCKRRLALTIVNWHIALDGEPVVTQQMDPAHPGRIVKFSIEQKLRLQFPECRRCNPGRMYSAVVRFV